MYFSNEKFAELLKELVICIKYQLTVRAIILHGFDWDCLHLKVLKSMDSNKKWKGRLKVHFISNSVKVRVKVHFISKSVKNVILGVCQ